MQGEVWAENQPVKVLMEINRSIFCLIECGWIITHFGVMKLQV